MSTYNRMSLLTALCHASNWSYDQLLAHVREGYPKGITPWGPAWDSAEGIDLTKRIYGAARMMAGETVFPELRTPSYAEQGRTETMTEITQEEFSKYDVVKPGSNPFTTEMAWFKHGDMLGIVLLDKTDHDWSFVALEQDADGRYRGFDLGVSRPSKDAARSDLEKIFRNLEQ
jgi:hypothetical protein